MQSRRGFFASLAGLFVAGLVDPNDLLKRIPVDSQTAIPISSADRLQMDMRRLTEFMHGQLVKELGGKQWPDGHLDHEMKIGETVRARAGGILDRFQPVLLDRHFGIDFCLDADTLERLTDNEIIELYVTPAMRRMGNEITLHAPKAFGRLPIPIGSDITAAARVEGNGISLRGLQALDLWSESAPSYVTRFDVLWG